MTIASGTLLLSYVTLQRLAELAIAKRNTRRLCARGAYEVDARQYPVMVALHFAWLITLWAFGWSHALKPIFFWLFVLLQVGRLWVLRTLGERWTTRIIMVPWAAPITTGPFRFVRHPNYCIVAVELPCIALTLGLVWHALLFGLLNLAMLAWRIRSENAAFVQMQIAR